MICDVSVVLPVYNGELTLERALNSILRQSLMPAEIIVVNDGSSDSTECVLREYFGNPNIIVITNEQNRGLVFSLNRGIDAATSKWIARIDADDIWQKNHLKNIYHWTTDNNELVLIGGRAEIHDEYNKLISLSSGPFNCEKLKSALIKDNPFVHSAVMFKKDVFLQAGKYCNAYKWEDYDLWINMLSYGCGCIVKDITAVHIKYSNSLSSVEKLTSLEERLKLQMKACKRLMKGNAYILHRIRLIPYRLRILFMKLFKNKA